MDTEHAVLVAGDKPPSYYDPRLLPSLCWRAIVGGTVAAIGIHILLTALGVGAGLATFSPISDPNPVEHFGIGAAVAWTLCAIVAVSFGGFIAGRFSHSLHSGFAHGVLVWCLTLIITLLLMSMGTGMVLGGALKVLGEGLGMSGKAATEAVAGVAQEAAKRSGDQLRSFIDEAVQSAPTNATPRSATRATREIGFAVTKLFAEGNDLASPENRTAAIKAMQKYSDMTEADATKAIDEWTTSYKKLRMELDAAKASAEQKAREAAERAAHNLSCAAIWSFFALAAGLALAAMSGSCGARRALRDLPLRSVPAV